MFLEYARRSMDEYRRMKKEIEPFTSLNKKRLVVCSEPGMTPYGTLDAIERFSAANPKIAVQFCEKGFEEHLDMLERQEADVAILWTENIDTQGYDTVSILCDETAVILSSAHPLAKEKTVDISCLREETFSVHMRCALGRMTEDLCARAGFAPRVGYRVSRTSSQIELAEMGKAVSLVMGERAFSWNNPDVAVLRLREPAVAHVLAVTLRDGASSEAKKFQRYLAYHMCEQNFTTARPI